MQLSDHLDELRKREEILWHHKSRVDWLVSSDLNTKYFHAFLVIRRSLNSIVRLKDDNQEWVAIGTTIGATLLQFF